MTPQAKTISSEAPDSDIWSGIQPLAARRILESALEHFARRGYHATTTREIAEDGGISTGGVYVHYASKAEILFAITKAGHQSSLRTIEAAQAAGGETHADRLRAMVRALTGWHVEHQGLARVVAYEQGALPKEQVAALRPFRRHIFRVFENELVAGKAANEFDVPDPTTTTRAVLSLCTDVARWYRPDLAPDVDGLALAYAEMALRLAGVPAAAAVS